MTFQERFSPSPEEYSKSENKKPETLEDVKKKAKVDFELNEKKALESDNEFQAKTAKEKFTVKQEAQQQKIAEAVHEFFDKIIKKNDKKKFDSAMTAAALSGTIDEFYERINESILTEAEQEKIAGEKITKELMKDAIEENLSKAHVLMETIELTDNEKQEIIAAEQAIHNTEIFEEINSTELRVHYINLNKIIASAGEKKQLQRESLQDKNDEKTNAYARESTHLPTAEELRYAKSEVDAFFDELAKEDPGNNQAA